MLTSLNNPTVKRLVRLRDNRARRKANKVIVDGWRETIQALDAGLVANGLFTNLQSVPESVQKRCGQLIQPVSDPVMEKISYGNSARSVVAEFEEPDWGIDQLNLPAGGLVLVLDQFEKPGNVGAVFRCADAAGVDAILLTDSLADRFNPNAIRSSLGAVFRVPSAAISESEAREFLARHRYQIFAARVETSEELWDRDLTSASAIVIGNEAHGLAERWKTEGQSRVDGIRIPMHGSVDSLNASVSASILMYEARRQRALV
ncbi:RNA methyltransferase [Stieleria sp. JC731]|uniref:TrmH family RNA methyltransferase n=1 Tax=Pirellulaceae TaxID=2691357 RepID=UPI001E5C8C50|nr:TrmH family RNA methyltransferase [Stieleria sp. JC731]MCC9603258.1 RNA methyltransferase [Stieleria sp. JC731]